MTELGRERIATLASAYLGFTYVGSGTSTPANSDTALATVMGGPYTNTITVTGRNITTTSYVPSTVTSFANSITEIGIALSVLQTRELVSAIVKKNTELIFTKVLTVL
jgi:hypothetical protein